jgi:hypothetical protein
MRINTKIYPILGYLKDFKKLESIPYNTDLFNKMKIINCDANKMYNKQEYLNNILFIRKTFSIDARKNANKLYDLFLNEIVANEESKVNFEHSGILIDYQKTVFYSFSKTKNEYVVDVFLNNGILVGFATLNPDNGEIEGVRNFGANFDDITFWKDALESQFFMAVIYILFKEFADVNTKFVESNKKQIDKKTGEKDLNESDFNITILDSTWYTNLIRSKGFKVSGHPRLQPCKIDGEWTYKMIWINEFMKNGYSRRAKKLIEETN